MDKNYRNILFLLLLLSPASLFPQIPDIWFFGRYAGIQINATGAQSTPISIMNTPEGCAVSDFGSYFSNGRDLWSPNNYYKITNNFSLNGNPLATQPALFAHPRTSNDTILLFTVDAGGGNKGLCYNIINYQLLSPQNRNIPLLTAASEKLALTRHCNRRNWWVMAHGWNNNKFYAYRITSDSLICSPVVTPIGSIHGGNAGNAAGYMKFTMDGDKLALAITGQDKVELFRFNNLDGSLSQPITLTGFNSPYGIEFDYYGHYLYVSEISGRIFQLDVSQWDPQQIIQSKTLIINLGSLTGALQLAYDRKIYVARDNASWLSAITHPESAGIACNFQIHDTYLGGAHCESGLPPTHLTRQSFELPAIKICIGDTAFFKIQGDTTLLDSVLWDFNVANDSINDSSTALNPFWIYPLKPTTYQFKVILYYCNESDTLTSYCEVMGAPIPNLGPDTYFCDNAITALYPGPATYYCWYDGDSSSTKLISTPGTYWVELINKCGKNSDTITITDIFPHPEVSLPHDTALCKPDSILLSSPYTKPYVNLWQDSLEFDSLWVSTPNFYHLCVTDTNDCKGYDTILVTFDTIPVPRLGKDTVICRGRQITLNGNTPGNQYHWNTGDMTPGITVNSRGLYTLTITNNCGSMSDSIYIEVSPCRQAVALPTAFTPNGDGINDVFRPEYENLSSYHLLIYNRWGQLVFESTNPLEGWDGTYKGQQAMQDVYTYMLLFTDLYNQHYRKNGFVVLYR